METDREYKRWLRDKLHNGVVEVQFRKADGTTRHMKATLQRSVLVDNDALPKNPEEKTEEEILDQSAQPVFDVEKEAWRSFRWDTIEDVKVDD